MSSLYVGCGSNKVISLEEQDVLENTLGIFHNGYFSSPCARAKEGPFLALSHEKLLGLQEVKPPNGATSMSFTFSCQSTLSFQHSLVTTI